MEGLLQALRQTPCRNRDMNWKMAHRAARHQMEQVWETMRAELRILDKVVYEALYDWAEVNTPYCDHVRVAGHLLEAIQRHDEYERASSQSEILVNMMERNLPDGEPRARFNAWWSAP